MQPTSLLSKIQVLTGLAAHRGYISFSGGYTEDVLRKMPLKELYQSTINQVFEMLKIATPENAREYRKLIKAVKVNFKAGRVRYINRTTIVGRNFTPKGMETERLYNRMLRVLESALQILKRIHTARPMAMQPDNLEEAFDGLIGEDWDRNAVLMQKMSRNDHEMDSFDQEVIDWTTKRSRDWLGIDLFSFSSISEEAAWDIVPHLNFHKFSLSELYKILTKYMRPEGLERTKHWASLSKALCGLGLAMIAKGGIAQGKRLAIEGLLMKVSNDQEVVEKTVEDLLHREFPNNMLQPTQNFSGLILAFRAGLLFEDTMPEGLDFQHVLLQPLQSEVIQPMHDPEIYGQLTYLIAAIFVLRQLKLEHIHEDRIAMSLFEALVSLGGGERRFLQRNIDLGYDRLHPFFTIYSWFCAVNNSGKTEFTLMYPDVARYCNRVLKNERQLNPSKLFTSFNIAINAHELTPLDQLALICAGHIATSIRALYGVQAAFPKLMQLSQRGLKLLKEVFPYVHELRAQAVDHMDQNGRLFSTAPTDIVIIFGNFIGFMRLKTPTFDEFLMMVADQGFMNESFDGHEWDQWIEQYPYRDRSIMTRVSPVYHYSTEKLVVRGFSPNSEIVNFTDILVSEEFLLEEFNKPFGSKLIYADRITPGKKLLDLNYGEYRLSVPDGFKNVHEPLLRNVAVKDPQLETDEVHFFLVFCYTHRIAGLTFPLAARLLKKSQEQEWKGIGEYCLAYMMGSTSNDNLLERWDLVQGHVAFAAYRYFCARFSMNALGSIRFIEKREEKERFKKVASTIFQERCDLPSPPVFVPVDLRTALPANQELICTDGKAFPINLQLMSLHSGYFERLLHFGGKEALVIEPIFLHEFSSECIDNLLAFIHSGVLPFGACELHQFLELCSAAQYFQMPILRKVLVARLKSHQIKDGGFAESILKKLAIFAMGYRPKTAKNELILLFNAARRYGVIHLEKEFAGLLGIPENSMDAFILYTRGEQEAEGFTQEQLDKFLNPEMINIKIKDI